MSDVQLTDRSSHFDFGKNWANYSQLVDDSRIDEAVRGMRRLCGADLQGKSFLDIGCGSGLHSLAANKLGAAPILGVDLDADSVATTRATLAKYAAGTAWDAREVSVFDLRPDVHGLFTIVYSWGVLHHTGDMYRALRAAAGQVRPGGLFIFALYRKTRLCGFWKIEKQWYARASPRMQAAARFIYRSLFRVLLRVNGNSYKRYVETYQSNRGMNFDHDVHDWMGGWPYESISPAEVRTFMEQLGFEFVEQFLVTKQERPIGLVGSGCDEYVYRRRQQ